MLQSQTSRAVILLIAAVVWIAGPRSATAAPPDLRGEELARALKQNSEVVFAVRKLASDGHWYANLGYYSDSELEQTNAEPHFHRGKRVAYRLGGKLCKLDVATGTVTTILDDERGGIRDPVVHYDGKIILFSYRQGDSENYHLYTIHADGTGLTQLTAGPYDDIEPVWLPDGDIMFISTRGKRWVNCWVTQVAILYRCDADGSHIRMLSSNGEHENTPWVMPDGRILYTRWEYVDRSQVDYHHLWIMNPDGTQQEVYFGNQTHPTLMIDAKPIPATGEVLAIFSPGHGRREHEGLLTIVNPAAGPDADNFAHQVHSDASFRDPFVLTRDLFMVARGSEIVLLNRDGREQVIHRLDPALQKAGFQLHEPRSIRPRPREPVIPSRVDLKQTSGRLLLANVYEGRNMAGVMPGAIKKLLVIEVLPKPINFTGGMDPLSYGGTFTLERIMGTVPVEPDGSAYMELPALRSLFFVALDKDEMSVKRMQSFLTLQPGEMTSCVGCHEQRTRTYQAPRDLQALRRAPSKIEPYADCPDVFDFPRDVQPILDRLCLPCHGYDRTDRGGPYAGHLILTGDRGPMFSHSYYMLTIAGLFSDGRNQAKSNYAPRTLGSSASRILKLIDGSHYDATATAREKRVLRLWIETGAPYPGTYAALGCGSIGGYAENKQVHTDFGWPQQEAAAEVINARCAPCHGETSTVLPRALSDERDISFWRPSFGDRRLLFARHIVFNLSRPEKSLILLAPLSEDAGGLGRCIEDGKPANVFANTEDKDYQKLLSLTAAGKQQLNEIKRFDMAGFRARAAYLRELQRFGILPKNQPADKPVDPYLLDQAYWRSLWYYASKEK